MVIVQKLTMVAYALHDGKKNFVFGRRLVNDAILSLSFSQKVKREKRVP